NGDSFLSKLRRQVLRTSWRVLELLHGLYVRRLLYCLTGGLPRLLRLQIPTATTLTQCFGLCRESAQSLFPIAQRSIAYTCLLVSSTKARVKGSDVVAVNPAWRDPADHARTFDDAMSHSIGTHDPVSDRFHVAPITFVDPMCPRDAPILPSQLHPFLKEDIVSRFGMHTAAEGTTLFGRIFLTALYARYLLTSWEDTTTPWVSLAKVLNGAVHPTRVPILERYQVNLSSGVVNATVDATQRRRARAVENAVTYMGRTSEPQCAYIWCRDVGGRGATFAVPLQLRSGGILNARNPSQLLLIVHRLNSEEVANENRFVAINASSMSCIDWLESTTS
ncbi:Bodo-specific multi-copy gene family, putative, partial [Bodo saltans]